MDIIPYIPKKISRRVVFVNGNTYFFVCQFSFFSTIPNLGVLMNSLLLPSIASKTAIELLTEIPVAKKIKNKY